MSALKTGRDAVEVLRELDEDPGIHFTIGELCNPHWDPYPLKWVNSGRYGLLVRHASVIREAWGHPLRVTPNGGYRSARHNEAQGGSARSQHVQGRALDLQPGEGTPKSLWDLIWRLWCEGDLPRLSGIGWYPAFVHIDVGGPMRKDGGPRRWGTWKRR